MSGDAGFEINGKTYPVPSVDSFDMNEATVFYDYTRLTIDQLFDLEGLPPTVVGALAHIAIRRAEPGLKDAEIKETVGKLKLVDLSVQLLNSVAVEDEEDAVPPTSDSSSTSSATTSGPSSVTTSAAVPASESPSGTGLPSSADAASFTSLTSV